MGITRSPPVKCLKCFKRLFPDIVSYEIYYDFGTLFLLVLVLKMRTEVIVDLITGNTDGKSNFIHVIFHMCTTRYAH